VIVLFLVDRPANEGNTRKRRSDVIRLSLQKFGRLRRKSHCPDAVPIDLNVYNACYQLHQQNYSRGPILHDHRLATKQRPVIDHDTLPNGECRCPAVSVDIGPDGAAIPQLTACSSLESSRLCINRL
jgi:hypothetical protein